MKENEKKNIEFSDVKDTDWAYPYISVAVSAGIVNGVSEKEFAQETDITREMAAVMLYRVVGLQKKALGGSGKEFKDGDFVSGYAKEAVKALGSAEIIKGDENGNFNPNNSLTRAEAAVLIYNFIR